MTTLALLICSNIFMTIAWYGHLKFTDARLWIVILAAWGIALVEYCFAVPANRIGYMQGFSGGQLKVMQEVVTLLVFGVFAVLVLKEPRRLHLPDRGGDVHVRGQDRLIALAVPPPHIAARTQAGSR
jgi:uncharacterized protein (DUF486 family)